MIQRFTHFLMEGKDKKEIFLLGYYISFLFVMTLASVLDFIITNYEDAIIEVIFILFTLISFSHYWYTKNVNVAVNTLVILATLTTYALLVSNQFNISIFHSIVPLGYFLLYTMKRSLLYTLIHQCIVISLYVYGYQHYPDSQALHDPAALTATAMASLMIILFGIFYHLAVENSYDQLEKSNAQKELLLKEVHHRVKNNLNIISSLLGLQQLAQNDPEIAEMMQKNRLRIDSIAMVHELLYKHEDFEKIDIHDYLEQLTKSVTSMCHEEIDIEIYGNHLSLPFDIILKLGIITNELLINSLKYAFNGNRGKVEISFVRMNNEYRFIYKDSGKTPVNNEQISQNGNLGYKLISIMVEQLEGKLNIHHNDGLIYTIRIPYV